MQAPTWHDSFRLLDSTPVPCAASRQTAKRSALWPYAGYGYCASHHRYFWGFRLYLVAATDGLPIAWCLATLKLGEREVAQALLDHEDQLIQRGWVVLGDKGFAGADFEGHLASLGTAGAPRPQGRTPRFGSMGCMRQWIEATFDTLKDQLGLERHGGRTLGGVFVRVAQRLLALAACICWNWRTGASVKRSLAAYDH